MPRDGLLSTFKEMPPISKKVLNVLTKKCVIPWKKCKFSYIKDLPFPWNINAFAKRSSIFSRTSVRPYSISTEEEINIVIQSKLFVVFLIWADSNNKRMKTLIHMHVHIYMQLNSIREKQHFFSTRNCSKISENWFFPHSACI